MADETQVRITLTGGPYGQVAVPGASPSAVLSRGASAVVSAETAAAFKKRLGSKALPDLRAEHVRFEAVEAEEENGDSGDTEDPLEGVTFASSAAEEAARQAGLTAEAFEGHDPSGKTGYTKPDVEAIVELAGEE